MLHTLEYNTTVICYFSAIWFVVVRDRDVAALCSAKYYLQKYCFWKYSVFAKLVLVMTKLHGEIITGSLVRYDCWGRQSGNYSRIGLRHLFVCVCVCAHVVNGVLIAGHKAFKLGSWAAWITISPANLMRGLLRMKLIFLLLLGASCIIWPCVSHTTCSKYNTYCSMSIKPSIGYMFGLRDFWKDALITNILFRPAQLERIIRLSLIVSTYWSLSACLYLPISICLSLSAYLCLTMVISFFFSLLFTTR